MKTIMLAPTDTRYQKGTHKVVLDFNDVIALGAGTTGTIAIIPATGTFPIGTEARFAGMKLVTSFTFSDGSINSLLLEVGDGNSTARLLSQTQIASTGTPVTDKIEPATGYDYPIVDTIDAKFTVAGGASPTLAEATAGEVHIYLEITDRGNRLQKVNGPLS